MTKQDYITQMEEAKVHSLTKRWNLQVENPNLIDKDEIPECSFCEMAVSCNSCPLGSISMCCDGLVAIFFDEQTEENAQAVFDFIKNVDIQAFADELEKKGYFSESS